MGFTILRKSLSFRKIALAGLLLSAGATGMFALWACEKKGDKAKEEDLTIVVEADRSKIAQEEQTLQTQLANFQKEKEQLLKEKSDLTSAKEQIKGQDQVQEQRLLENEKRLLEKERSMREREESLDQERSTIDKKKAELERTGGKPAAGGAPVTDITQREKGLADRESKLATREGELAGREKELAVREEELNRQEAAFFKLQGTLASARVPIGVRSGGAGQTVSHDAADKAHKAAVAKMRQKGILWEDLPVEAASLRNGIADGQKKGDPGKVLDLAEQLDALVSATPINGDFITRKFQWLNKLKQEKPPSAKDNETVKGLVRKATQLYGDGKFVAANEELNRIYALLMH